MENLSKEDVKNSLDNIFAPKRLKLRVGGRVMLIKVPLVYSYSQLFSDNPLVRSSRTLPKRNWLMGHLETSSPFMHWPILPPAIL